MRKFRILTIILALTVLALLAGLAQSTPWAIGWRDYLGLLLFFLVYLVSETQPLQLPGTISRITISGLASYALIALFSPLHAAAVGATAVLVVELFLEKKTPLKVAFNTSQIFVSIIVASIGYHALEASQFNAIIPGNVIAVSAAVIIYFAVNTAIVSFGLSQLQQESFWRIWKTNHKWELVYGAGSIPVALLLIVVYQRLWIAGPLLFVGPMFLLRESYAQYVRLQTTYTETVRTLIKVIEMHDTYTAGHSLRVAEYAKRLAVAKKLSVKAVEKIEIAAYLHDLGKVDLAITHLVRKPGRLTPDEKRRVQLHPLVSADIAAQVTYFRGEIERVIRHHHEHYNGTGYPHGQRGTDIPLGSRIILIADAFDAMTSNRMYRSSLDFTRVRSEFIKYSGIQFDPELVPIFLDLCVKDESMIIPQHEVPYEDLLSTQINPVMVSAVG